MKQNGITPRKMVGHDRGDTTTLVPCKEKKAFNLLFDRKAPEQIAMELSIKWLPRTHYFVALRRVPRNRDPRENVPFKDHEYDPDQLKLDFPDFIL